ncbi:hypothetical protein Lcho_3035 [Leptothrix cholodnii SP-6]|uniref:Uncharacterized protein n=1 Tax=Leptothrix cholodnii (strain ATCC 51168 / LMG 8142 / SP-6) TaxID=395495 RepID=B1XZC5_LEPCP|nr:hypothetical protein [Leptothrix cholodnii]ACB35295.1 hypothetical protein Lcho_3035 [Leptothrix cholodnii SP-6]
MTRVIHELERVEHRVLGALRCIDVNTGVALNTPMTVEIPQARLLRNRSGLHVIHQLPALAAHEAVFDAPPASPAQGSVQLTATVRDPAGRYLPRLAAIALPRDPAADNADQADSLFRPIDVALFPASTAATGANWCVLRVSVTHNTSDDALGGALLLVRQGNRTLARGLTDWRGEALVSVPGVPITTWSDVPGSVVVNEITAQIIAVFDPAAGLRTSAARVRDGREPAALPLVDPDRLEAQRNTLPRANRAVQLSAGTNLVLSLSLALP